MRGRMTVGMMIGHLELFVRDPLASRDFYQRVLGFEVVAVQGSNVWLKLGAMEVLLRPGRSGSGERRYQDSSAAIVLYTDDLPTGMEQLSSRGLQFSGNDGSPKCVTSKSMAITSAALTKKFLGLQSPCTRLTRREPESRIRRSKYGFNSRFRAAVVR